MPTITELVAVVAEDALGLGAPGLAIAALAGVAVIGAPRARPLAKGAIKGYFSLKAQAYALKEHTSEWVAETREGIEDLYAEAKHEYSVQVTDDTAEPATTASAVPTAAASPAEPKAPAEQPELAQAHTLTEAVQKAAAADAPARSGSEQPTAEPAGRARVSRPRHSAADTVQAPATSPHA